MIEPNLLFSSKFDADVQIEAQYGESGAWVQKISGLDSVSNYSWENDFPGNSILNYFSYNVNIDKVLDGYVTTTIETVVDAEGNEILALHQVLKRDDTDNPSMSRSQFNVFPTDDETMGNLKHIYIKYDIKLQENLNDVLSQRVLMEWNNTDYRWGLYIVKDVIGTPIWQLQAETLSGEEPVVDWIEVNNNVTVPIGEFFKLEVFWKHSSDVDGRVWVAVNGQDVFYHRGRNKIDHKIGVWNPFKMLGSLELGIQEQWITNVEVWDDIPLSKTEEDSNLLLYAVLAGLGVLVWTGRDEETEEEKRKRKAAEAKRRAAKARR